MPRPSKFTAERKTKILEALTVGASRSTAAAIGGVDRKALARWLERGAESPPESAWHEFYEQVLEAEAHPRMRALGVLYNELPNRPDLAWKFVERREPGFAPPMPNPVTSPSGPIVIQLALHDGAQVALAAPPALELAEVVEEAEVVDEQDEQPAGTPSQSA